jgi:hypothetical protein
MKIPERPFPGRGLFGTGEGVLIPEKQVRAHSAAVRIYLPCRFTGAARELVRKTGGCR